MSNRKKLLKFITVILAAIIIFPTQILPPALAAATYDVSVPSGVTKFSIDLTVNEPSPYAGIEFGLTLSSETELNFVSFQQGTAVKGASSSPFTAVNGVHYFGFYKGTNAFSGNTDVGTLNFTYTGDATQTIVLTHMQVARIERNRAAGTPKNPPVATFTVKRAAGGTGSVVVSGESDGLSFKIRLGDAGGKTKSSYFEDVDENWRWAVNEIDYLYEAGVIKGTGAGKYSPGAKIQRGDFILMLVRAYHLEGSFDGNFSDVPPDSYFYDAIGIAKTLGIALGVGGNNFAPNEPITRQDMMTLVDRTLRAVGKPLPAGSSADLEPFTDRDEISGYASIPVATLIQSGIIKGNNLGMISPQGHTTRAEMAVVVYRLLTMETV